MKSFENTSMRGGLLALGVVLLLLAATSAIVGHDKGEVTSTRSGMGTGTGDPVPPVLIDEISPPAQRVGELISIRGSGFGAFDAARSRVRFLAGGATYIAPVPYTWRDDYISIEVPSGEMISGESGSLPPGLVSIVVVNGDNVQSFETTFRVEGTIGGTFNFSERTQISNNMDISNVLANPNINNDPKDNKARTKDAEVGDINGDGYPDILDNNSNNETNNTHGILRTNNKDGTFTSIWLEPLNVGDIGSGSFASTVPVTAIGFFFGDGVSYEADFADIDNDGHADILQASTEGSTQRVRILMNNQPTPGSFMEDTVGRMPGNAISSSGCPDDIAHGDLDCDGWIDFAVTLRKQGACGGVVGAGKSETRVFLNKGASDPGRFEPPIILDAPDDDPNDPNDRMSAHDVFFIDFNDDMAPDIVIVNEPDFGDLNRPVPSQLFRHNGNFANPAFTLHQELDFMGFAGDPADFDNDGAMDFAIVGLNVASVFLNNPNNPGNFTEVPLPGTFTGALYDVELGDIDLDGDVDIIAASITTSVGNSIAIWRNDGGGSFTNLTSGGAGGILPGIGNFQRLSADLIDYDMDGDLDLYIAGADGQSVGQGFGAVPNQLFENLVN